MKNNMAGKVIVALTTVGTIIYMIFFATPIVSIIFWGVVSTILIYILIGVAMKVGDIYPDENGNYPIRYILWKPVNPNIDGANRDPRAWTYWQATNNKSSVGAHILANAVSRQEVPRLPSGPGEEMVIDAVASHLRSPSR